MKPRLTIMTLLAGGVGLGVVAIAGVVLFGPATPDTTPGTDPGAGDAPDAQVDPTEGEEFGPICTMMGCIDGLTVEFSGDVPSDYHVDVTGEEGEAWQTDCHVDLGLSAEGMGCLPQGGVRIDGITPSPLTITVTWEGGSKTETFEPDYQITQPNGPQCDPTCYQASLTLSLP